MARLRIIRCMALCFCTVAIALSGLAEPAGANQDAAAKGAVPFYAYCMEDGVPGIHPRPVAQQAAILAAIGFDGAGYILWLDDQLDKNLAALRGAGLKLYMAYAFLDLKKPGQPYDRRVPEAIARLKGQPAIVCVLLSGRKPGDPQAMEPAVKALRELADAAAKAGVRISIYNHVGDWTERVSFALEVAKKVDRPNVGVNFNLCHWLMVEGRKDYRPLIRENARKIFTATICGAQAGAKTWLHGLIQPLDRGDFDNRQLLTTLREAGYQGPIGLMCESIPDDLQEHLARSMKVWRNWQADRPSGFRQEPSPMGATTRRALAASAAVPLPASPAATNAGAAAADYQSKYVAVSLSPLRPAFTHFALDSLGRGRVQQNPVLAAPNAVAMPGLKLTDRFAYALNGQPLWRLQCGERTLTLSSDFAAAAPPLLLEFKQRANHATLLGLMRPGQRRMSLPCVLHLPDMGSVRITGSAPGLTLDYDAQREAKPAFVRIAFPPATAQQRRVEYRFEVAAIYPRLPGIEGDARYDGFRRDWLNIFQVNPRVQMLANNSASDVCAFTLFEYSAVARHTPPLAEGLTCLDLIRMTVDRYLAGAKGYGQVGYAGWPTPWTSLDSLPSLLIAACDYAEGAPDLRWAGANYAGLLAWARAMAANDVDGDGLLEYPSTGNFGDRPLTRRRPSNWWDTINFGHKDAFANALAYRAFQMFGELAGKLGHADDANFFKQKAAKLRAAYAPTFLNPATGVLAGWKSADGQLHDYWFTYVQGLAIAYGLLDDKTANGVMDRLLAKMKAVGYTRFDMGLPGNLVPVKKGDYIYENHRPEESGEPRLEDGSDGFQFYENGGATGCFAYYPIKALYQLGRVEDARRILHPMLAGYARGEFQGFDSNGMSRDWRDWKGGGHGYEGLLVDNYLALLAVLDDVKASPPAPQAAK